MRKTVNYIDNKEFLRVLVEHKEACKLAIEQNKPEPRIPEYIGKCFLLISENLSHKANFSRYTFIDDAKSSAVLNCLQYYKNFDPEKSQNPFSYFTQIIYYAFLRKIMKEKKQLYIKYKSTEQQGILDESELYEDSDGNVIQFELYANISEFIHNYETARDLKKQKKIDKIEQQRLLKDFDLLEKDENES